MFHLHPGLDPRSCSRTVLLLEAFVDILFFYWPDDLDIMCILIIFAASLDFSVMMFGSALSELDSTLSLV